jgi:O-antigen/teichoic acid export membrane protein
METSEVTLEIGEKQRNSRRLSFSVFVGDIAKLSSGTLLAAVFSTLLVFLIPRVVSVEDFGYWRLFMLYAGYAGFLHLGFADGALLCWAGRPFENFHGEIQSSLKFMFWQHLAFIVPISLTLYLLSPRFRFLGIAVLCFALVFNLACLLQYSLQGARLFKPVAIATALPVATFAALVALRDLKSRPNYKELIALYCVSWLFVLAYLWASAKFQERPVDVPSSPWGLGIKYTLLGWPILLANGGFILAQSADRLVVSSALPIHDFAQYSLAASAMIVPVTAIAAIYKVFFSHIAAVEQHDRTKAYAHASRFVLIGWSLLLPYYFILEFFVRQILPNYVAGLAVAQVLLVGVIFLAGIQILHMSFAYLHGQQRKFLLCTIAAVVVIFSLVIVLALQVRSLLAIAVGQVAAMAGWWLCDEWNLRKITGQNWKEWSRVWAVFGWSTLSYFGVAGWTGNVAARTLIYYTLVVGALYIACPNEVRLGWRLMGGVSTR